MAEVTASQPPVPVERVGFPGFLPTGSVDWLFEQYGLTPTASPPPPAASSARKKT